MPTSMINADTPNLWEIKRSIGEAKTRAILIYSLAWLAQLVNVERNLNDLQISEITNDIITEYGFLKIEELKYIFKQAVKRNKIYGRMDYNVVMTWVEEYCFERTEHCIDISNQQETQAANKIDQPAEAVSWEQYVERLWNLALYADELAVEKLSQIESSAPSTMKLLTTEEKRQREIDFRQYYYNNYLKNKQKN